MRPDIVIGGLVSWLGPRSKKERWNADNRDKWGKEKSRRALPKPYYPPSAFNPFGARKIPLGSSFSGLDFSVSSLNLRPSFLFLPSVILRFSFEI